MGGGSSRGIALQVVTTCWHAFVPRKCGGATQCVVQEVIGIYYYRTLSAIVVRAVIFNCQPTTLVQFAAFPVIVDVVLQYSKHQKVFQYPSSRSIQLNPSFLVIVASPSGNPGLETYNW